MTLFHLKNQTLLQFHPLHYIYHNLVHLILLVRHEQYKETQASSISDENTGIAYF